LKCLSLSRFHLSVALVPGLSFTSLPAPSLRLLLPTGISRRPCKMLESKPLCLMPHRHQRRGNSAGDHTVSTWNSKPFASRQYKRTYQLRTGQASTYQMRHSRILETLLAIQDLFRSRIAQLARCSASRHMPRSGGSAFLCLPCVKGEIARSFKVLRLLLLLRLS